MPTCYGQVFGKKWKTEQTLTDEIPETCIGYKRCTCCGKVKHRDMFENDDLQYDGKSRTCMECGDAR